MRKPLPREGYGKATSRLLPGNLSVDPAGRHAKHQGRAEFHEGIVGPGHIAAYGLVARVVVAVNLAGDLINRRLSPIGKALDKRGLRALAVLPQSGRQRGEIDGRGLVGLRGFDGRGLGRTRGIEAESHELHVPAARRFVEHRKGSLDVIARSLEKPERLVRGHQLRDDRDEKQPTISMDVGSHEDRIAAERFRHIVAHGGRKPTSRKVVPHALADIDRGVSTLGEIDDHDAGIGREIVQDMSPE